MALFVQTHILYDDDFVAVVVAAVAAAVVVVVVAAVAAADVAVEHDHEMTTLVIACRGVGIRLFQTLHILWGLVRGVLWLHVMCLMG